MDHRYDFLKESTLYNILSLIPAVCFEGTD